MPEPANYLVVFDGFSSTRSRCHALVADNGLVLGELDDNPGTSLTNALELAYVGLLNKFFNNEEVPLYEWLPRDPVTGEAAMFKIVWHDEGFRMPEWAPVTTVAEYPRFVAEAEEAISLYEHYTWEVLSQTGMQTVDLGDTRKLLKTVRERRPSRQSPPDRPPRSSWPG